MYEDDELVYTYTYIWDGDVLLGGRMEVTDADEPITIRYLYDESGELYGMDYNGNGYFAFIKNLQGDIVSIIPLDPESNVEINMEYDAWGKPIHVQGSSLAEGFMMAVLTAVTNVGYRGYFYDFETGLYYLRSRYYDPETGRFINADDTGYLGYDDTPLSMNLFAYCKSSPIMDSDSSGAWSLKGHESLSLMNKRLGEHFITWVKYYNKLCDTTFPTNGQIRTPFHASKTFKIFNASLVKIFNLAVSVGGSKKRKFKYNEIFNKDDFTCYDLNKNSSPNTQAAKNKNNEILNVINNGYDKYKVKTGLDQKAILLGFCLHMLQDYYAHMIMASSYVVKKGSKVDSKGKDISMANLDIKLSKEIKGFRRCSIEDNEKVFKWRYKYARENSLEIINMIRDSKKMKEVQLKNYNKYSTYEYKINKTYKVSITTYEQKLIIKR